MEKRKLRRTFIRRLAFPIRIGPFPFRRPRGASTSLPPPLLRHFIWEPERERDSNKNEKVEKWCTWTTTCVCVCFHVELSSVLAGWLSLLWSMKRPASLYRLASTHIRYPQFEVEEECSKSPERRRFRSFLYIFFYSWDRCASDLSDLTEYLKK